MKKMSSYEKSLAETSELPFGAFNNESSPSANDGTDIVAEHLQDLYYPLYQILQLSGQTPNGTLENCSNNKQFLNALSGIVPLLYDSSLSYKKNSISLNIYNGEINVYQSKKDENKSTLSDSNSWNLLTKITASGVFNNVALNSPTMTGIPTAPTALNGNVSKQIANTEFVKKAFHNFIKVTSGRNTNGAVIYPPEGYTIADLVAFIPAISEIHYAGDVDKNDSTYCNYTINEDHILLTSKSSEQRKKTFSNWIAIWIKQ